VIKLADLGMAKFIEGSIAKSFAGTRAYMSPEVSNCENKEGEYTIKSDIWFEDLYNFLS